MKILARCTVAALLTIALPILADDKTTEKQADKKDVPKSAPAPKVYQSAGTLNAKVVKVDAEGMILEIETLGRNARKQEMTMVEDVKVRMLNLPERRDEKNRPLPYTPQEKAKLKGDNTKLPGYHAELSDVKKGSIVEVHLGTNKTPPGQKKSKEAEKPFVTMIVVAGDDPKATGDKKKAKE